jgi:hypothetical protein
MRTRHRESIQAENRGYNACQLRGNGRGPVGAPVQFPLQLISCELNAKSRVDGLYRSLEDDSAPAPLRTQNF